MKIDNKTQKIMLALMITAGLALNVTSCKKDSTTTASDTVTEADAAQLTTDAVIPSTGGMVTQLSSATTIYITVSLSCGVQKDSTIAGSSAAGVVPSYSYSLNYNYILTCDGAAPSALTFNHTGTANYSGALFSSSDKSTGGFVMTGFGASSPNYIFNESYSRVGTSTSKIARQNTFNSILKITSTNVAVDKITKQIVSGTATVAITATSTSGKSFTFNGTINFLGGKKANLVLNSGATYVISWS